VAELEQAKRRIITKLTDDIILDYDIKTDTANMSNGFRELFGLEEESMSGFRHFVLNNENLDQAQRERVLADVIKLNRQEPDMEMDLDVKTASGVFKLRAYITALFDGDAENGGGKAGYVAKIVRP
jgi:PAS domain-containing protein